MTQQDSSSGKQKVPYLTNTNAWFIMDSVPRMSKKQIWKWKQRTKGINTVYTKLYGAKDAFKTR